MKFQTHLHKASLFMMLVLLSIIPAKSRAAEFVIMNQVISWDINSGDGFWSFKPDITMPANWVTPYNYYEGKIYTRYELIKLATDTTVGMQFDMFQWKNAEHTVEGELCESVRWLKGIGDVEINSSVPSTWWKANEGVDFSKIYDMQSFSVTIWSSAPQSPICKAHAGGDDAGLAWSRRLNYFPCEVRVTIVAVSVGSTFSGWDHYVPPASSRKPEPAYGIDYMNETTDAPVPSTDHYSMFPQMTYSVDGTGSNIILEPGRRYYFETKAADGLLKSPMQILVVPERPATPAFTLDVINNRTAAIVDDTYEYSDNADMSGAVTGPGDYVSIAPGTTRYFRKKATATTFASKVQTLNSAYKPPVAHEFLIYNGVVDFPNTTDTNGFYYFWHNANMPVNWLTPDNYYTGQIYTRYEIISEKTSEPVGLQFGIWQKCLPETGELYETMSEIKTLNGPGSIVTANSSPSSWWKLNGGIDYTRMNTVWHFGINPWKVSNNSQIRQENPGTWSERNSKWFPMKVYVTVVAVASGKTFSGWENYVTIGAAPTYTIDFINETTNAIVPSTDQYAYNITMSGAVSGSGQKLALTPGNNVYFNTRAHDDLPSSAIQTLVVPSRSVTPTFVYDMVNNRTTTVVTSEYEYSTSPTMAGAITGTGNYVAFAQGTTMYFRKKATASAFKSEIQVLQGNYQAPESPAYSIDFQNERTTSTIVATDEYSTNMTSWTSGTGAILPVTPGQDVYIRVKAQGYYPASDTQHLYVPARPSTPAFTIDYLWEETIEEFTSAYEYAYNSGMISAITGAGQYLDLNPGSVVYIRRKATANSFASQIQTLNVPVRPAAPTFAINYVNETTETAVSSDYQFADNSVLAWADTGNGQVVKLIPGTPMYFRKKYTTSSFASDIQTLNVPSRPSAPSFTIDYVLEKTAETLSSEYEYALASDMTGAIRGSGSKVTIAPGTSNYFRKAATASAFSSNIQTINAPARPATPDYTINYALARTNEVIVASDEFANNSNMTGAASGTGATAALIPGTDMYFRTKATTSAFCSAIQFMNVDSRPSAPLFTIDYGASTTNEIISDQFEISEQNNFNTLTRGTGAKLTLIPGKDLYFRQIASDHSFSSSTFLLDVPDRNTLEYFGSDTVTVNFFVVRASIPDGSAFSLDDLMISNGTAQNLRAGNVFDVYATTKGTVVVSIPANSVSANSFASNVIRVYYDNSITGIPQIEEDKFNVYPNPVINGNVNILTETALNYSVDVISASGTLVKSFGKFEGRSQLLDVSDLPKGMYVLKISSSKGISLKKVMIE